MYDTITPIDRIKRIERKEVKGIEWAAVGKKDGDAGRGIVGVSGTWLSV